MFLSLEDDCAEFKDVIIMTGQASLYALCKSFNLTENDRKTHFPHKFASEKHLKYIGDVQSEELWEEGEIPAEHVGKETFDFKATSNQYQKLDVVSLCLIWNDLSRALHGATGLDTSDFISAPSLALKYIMKCAPEGSISVCCDRSVEAFCRESVQGGICFPQKARFKSNEADRIMSFFKD